MFACVHVCIHVPLELCANMCVAVCLPGSWWCHHPGGFAGRIQSCKRWCSGLHCRSGVQDYCIWALHCGLRVPGSQWLHTNNVHNYKWACVWGGGFDGKRKWERERDRDKETKKKSHLKLQHNINLIHNTADTQTESILLTNSNVTHRVNLIHPSMTA